MSFKTIFKSNLLLNKYCNYKNKKTKSIKSQNLFKKLIIILFRHQNKYQKIVILIILRT